MTPDIQPATVDNRRRIDANEPGWLSQPRRQHSVRRTSSIDFTWPGGYSNAACFEGRGRDLLTQAALSDTTVLDDVRMSATATDDRVISDIVTSPPIDGCRLLQGLKAGGAFRQALATALPDERRKGSVMYLLLDDLAVTTLLSGWARMQSQRTDEEPTRPPSFSMAGHRKRMEGVCIGHARGSSALTAEVYRTHSQWVPPFWNPDDPLGWHELPQQSGIYMRRARRIDVWGDAVIHIDAGFQDSGAFPDRGRQGIHEYRLEATADRRTLALLTLSATSGVLPYPECPSAIGNIQRLIGTSLAGLRESVLTALAKTDGCTHLNDALRALAEVPQLVEAAEKRRRSGVNLA